MTNLEFVEEVQRIAASNPTYRTGGDGSDGTCDCIGLIMGALGGKFDMHSSNWFARYMMYSLGGMTGNEHHIALGDLVYKALNGNQRGYDLNERYMPGGTHDTGDLLDYYHAGVVTSIVPMEITHCTSTGNVNGITKDTSLNAWTHFGQAKDVVYIGAADAQREEVQTMYVANVMAKNGETVNMRTRPDEHAPLVMRVPLESKVMVLEEADGWAKIRYSSKTGYMMSRFLLKPGTETEQAQTGETEEKLVTIQLPEKVARELRNALAFID